MSDQTTQKLAAAPSNGRASEVGAEMTSVDKGKGKARQPDPEDEDDEEDDDDDEDDEEEEEDEQDDDEELDDTLDDDFGEIDPSNIVSTGRRRNAPMDYSSEEALKQAGLDKAVTSADHEDEDAEFKGDDMEEE